MDEIQVTGGTPEKGLLRTLIGHASGRRAVSASADQTLKVWELASGRELRTLQGHTAMVKAAAVTPDGRRAVSASHDGTLKVWELESGRELQTLEGHNAMVNAVAMTPDGRVVTAVDDGRLRVWELESGRANCELSKATPLGSTR